VVTARLQRDVERRPAGRIAGGGQRVGLGVRAAVLFVPALADDHAVTENDRPDKWIRLHAAAAALRQFECPPHPVFVAGHADILGPAGW
jgi:hypothetical protein